MDKVPEQIGAMLDAENAAATGAEHAAAKDANNRPNPCMKRVRRMSLADFKRDFDQRNVLIHGGWGKRGGTSMHVSTMGSGKSTLQTQSVLCFNRGIPCCGLRPVRPFKMWVIQSEDDEDRVAFDRDSVAEKLAAQYPDQDWNAAIRETRFLDFTGITGANFIETLNNELFDGKPDGVAINPFNAFFGKDPCDHAACTAFWKGGELGRKETEGIEAVFKRHNVWGWFFGHTAQPPQSAKQLRDWLNDPYSAYKACGSSATPDALRSIITFLRVPGTDTFAFNAGKNGNGLGWTDADGNRTLRAFYRWSADGKHFWCDVPKDEWAGIADTLENYGKNGRGGTPKPPKPPPPPPRDETPVVVRVFGTFANVVDRQTAELAVRDAVNAERRMATPVVKDLSRNDCRSLIDLMAARGVIRILPKGTRGTKGCMCGLPDVVERFLNPPLIEVPTDADRNTPGSGGRDEPPTFGRSRKRNKGVKV